MSFVKIIKAKHNNKKITDNALKIEYIFRSI